MPCQIRFDLRRAFARRPCADFGGRLHDARVEGVASGLRLRVVAHMQDTSTVPIRLRELDAAAVGTRHDPQIRVLDKHLLDDVCPARRAADVGVLRDVDVRMHREQVLGDVTRILRRTEGLVPFHAVGSDGAAVDGPVSVRSPRDDRSQQCRGLFLPPCGHLGLLVFEILDASEPFVRRIFRARHRARRIGIGERSRLVDVVDGIVCDPLHAVRLRGVDRIP